MVVTNRLLAVPLGPNRTRTTNLYPHFWFLQKLGALRVLSIHLKTRVNTVTVTVLTKL